MIGIVKYIKEGSKEKFTLGFMSLPVASEKRRPNSSRFFDTLEMSFSFVQSQTNSDFGSNNSPIFVAGNFVFINDILIEMSNIARR